MSILVKKHIANHKLVLAVCDERLVGKKFEDDGILLDVNEGFYKGQKEPEEKIVQLMGSAHIINIVGKDSVALAINAGIISKENIITVKGIPHAQCIKLCI